MTSGIEPVETIELALRNLRVALRKKLTVAEDAILLEGIAALSQQRAEIESLKLQLSNSAVKVGAPIRYTTGSALDNKFYSGELTDEKREQITGMKPSPLIEKEEAHPNQSIADTGLSLPIGE